MSLCGDLLPIIFSYVKVIDGWNKFSRISAKCRRMIHSYWYIRNQKYDDLMKIFLTAIRGDDVALAELCLRNKEFAIKDDDKYTYNFCDFPDGLWRFKCINDNPNFVVPPSPEMVRLLLKNKKIIELVGEEIIEEVERRYCAPVMTSFADYDIDSFDLGNIFKDDDYFMETMANIIKAFYHEDKKACRRLLELFGEIRGKGERKDWSSEDMRYEYIKILERAKDES